MSASSVLTVGILRQLLDYDPATGVFTWKVTRPRATAGSVAGSISEKGYRIIGLCGRLYKAHRLAWLYMRGEWPVDQIDHINGIKDDNRIANLRDVTNRVNAQNLKGPRSDNTSGFLGVRSQKTPKARKWTAKIVVDGRHVHLGYFPTPVAAHEAYLSVRRRFYEGNTL